LAVTHKRESPNREYIFQIIDALKEQELSVGQASIGTTRKGIGPAYSSKASRSGIRVSDLEFFDKFKESFLRLVANKHKRFGEFPYDVTAELTRYAQFKEDIRPFVVDSVLFLNEAYQEGKKILIEGAQSTMLDLDFGTYPYVTSSSSSVGGACTGLGISPDKIKTVIGVAKAYTTRVGAGPFPTELHGDLAEELRKEGGEYGTTTGRPRRIGWLDTVVLRYTHLVNNYTYLNIAKIDVLSKQKELKIGVAYLYKGERLRAVPASLHVLAECTVEYETLPGWCCDISRTRKFEDLPQAAQYYITKVEKLVGVKVKWVGVGPDRKDMIER
jgi:adenylosuccinate synthase